jgi:HAD superfamily hydrolase (TIGR01509 family)
MTSPVVAVVFDLDGVLLESEQVWSQAKRELVAERGGSWQAAAEEEMLGMSSPEWSRYMREQLNLEMPLQEISPAVVELMLDRYRRELPLIAGADAAVRRLARAWPLGMASASNREVIDAVIELGGWQSLFRVTVSAEEVPRGKPAPDVYLEAVRRLDGKPAGCVAIEDSAVGIAAAHAAGLGVVAIPNRVFPPEPAALALADVVLGSIAELDGATVARAGSR